MVSFYNIKVENGILTAHAVNESTCHEEDIKAMIDGSRHSSRDSDIVRATWGVVWEAKKAKKFPKETTISWG